MYFLPSCVEVKALETHVGEGAVVQSEGPGPGCAPAFSVNWSGGADELMDSWAVEPRATSYPDVRD